MTKLRWGILGAARIARQLIPSIREAGGEIVALGVRDPSSERAQAFSREWEVPIVGGYQEVVDADLDAIYNPLPNDLHLPWTLKTLQAGKHALTEKPFTLNAAEAQQLADAAQQTGQTLLEAFAPRFHPYMLRLKEIVQSGELGELRAVRAASGFTLNNPDDFRWDAGKGGGALYDVGTYGVNLMRFLLGEPQSALAYARWTEGGVDMGLSGVLEYPTVLASLDTGFDWDNQQRSTIIGALGTVDVDRVSGGYTHEPTVLRISTRAGQRQEEFAPQNAYAAMVGHFQRVALGQEEALYPPSDAVAQARVLDALYESARTGQKVAIPQGR